MVVDGESVLVPPLLFAQSSIYQERDEYPIVRRDNRSVVVVSSDSTQFTTDWMIRQGYPNWYMLLWARRRRLTVDTRGSCCWGCEATAFSGTWRSGAMTLCSTWEEREPHD